MFANGNNLINFTDKAIVWENIFLIIAAAVFSMPILPWIKKKLAANDKVYFAASYASTVGCVLLLVICSILLAENATNPFLYFRF